MLNKLLIILTYIRFIILKFNINFYSYKRINKYGPFKIHIYFFFSDFKNWGKNTIRKYSKKQKKLINYKSKNYNMFDLIINISPYFDNFIDVGAHIGLVTLPVASVMNKNSQIHSFEPSSLNFKFLNYHVKKNQAFNVNVHNCLIGNQVKNDIKFYENKIPDGMNNMYNFSKKNKFLKCKSKNMITLDSFCKNMELLPDIIKIDVEGAEIDVLFGCAELLAKGNTIFIVSIHLKQIDYAGKKISELTSYLQKYSYEFYNQDLELEIELKSQEYMLLNKLNLKKIQKIYETI